MSLIFTLPRIVRQPWIAEMTRRSYQEVRFIDMLAAWCPNRYHPFPLLFGPLRVGYFAIQANILSNIIFFNHFLPIRFDLRSSCVRGTPRCRRFEGRLVCVCRHITAHSWVDICVPNATLDFISTTSKYHVGFWIFHLRYLTPAHIL